MTLNTPLVIFLFVGLGNDGGGGGSNQDDTPAPPPHDQTAR